MSDLDLETFARILARLAHGHGDRLREILLEMGRDPASFERAAPALLAELSGAWPNRKGITAMKFATALGTELTRLGTLLDNRAPDMATVVAASLSPAVEAPLREQELPSFLKAPTTPGESSAPSGSVAVPELAPPAIVDAPAPKSAIAGTVNMDLSAIVAAARRDSTPFKPSDTPSAASVPSRPGHSPADTERESAPSAAGRTADLSAVVSAVKQAALPFTTPGASAADLDFAELPLETYASVTGALARGESREEALARHRLRADVFDKLAKAWAQRFQREPHLLARFQELARSTANAPRGAE